MDTDWRWNFEAFYKNLFTGGLHDPDFILRYFFYTSYRWKNQSIQYINNYEYTKFQNNLLQFEEKLRLTSSQSANSDKKVRNRILIYAFRQIFHDNAVLYQNGEELYNGTAYDFDVQGIQEQLGEVELHGKWYDADTYICDPLISKADGKTLLHFFLFLHRVNYKSELSDCHL